jgi:hypothetical protein
VQLAYIRFCNPEKRAYLKSFKKNKKTQTEKLEKLGVQEKIRQSEPTNRGAEP